MEFSANRKAILESLAHCIDVAKRGTNSLAQSVRIDADKTGVVFTSIATPLCMKSVLLNPEVTRDGSIAIHCSGLFERVRAMPEGDVNIMVDGTSVTIGSVGRTRKSTMAGMPSKDFPLFPVRPEEEVATMPASALLWLIEKVAYAAYDDEGHTDRQHFAGCYVTIVGNRAEGASFDGRVMSVASVENKAICGFNHGSFFIVTSATRATQALLSSVGHDEVTIRAAGNRVHIVCGAGELQYPLPQLPGIRLADEIRRVAPKDGVRADRSALLAAAKAVSVGVESAHCVTEVDVRGGKAHLLVQTSAGRNEEVIDTSGERDFRFGIDAKRLAKCLATMEGDTVELADGIFEHPIALRCGDMLSCIARIPLQGEVSNAA